jgi:hypothetical protein
MAWLALLAGGLLILVMIGIAGYGWVTLPPDARVPIHHGIGSYNNYVSKRAGLVTWPMAGLLVYAILIAVAGHAIAPNHASRPVALIILLVALAAVSAAQAGAIRAARRSTPGSSS